MASLPSVAAIVNGADLDPSNIPQVKSLFARFARLSPAEKDDQRGSFVDRVFPLFFGDNAVTDGSSAYEAQRPSPMVKQLLAPTAGSGAPHVCPAGRNDIISLSVFRGQVFHPWGWAFA
ncbi:hypothetical protein BDV37DRAFT_286497 [Aspergillus pseudonomiae]|uniref:Uncharacterized protein n=1 Tax=Aspergillus pseudonomiae TaxID=1506151 RepID=A0A5N7D448_9EURO|nr:uncharacterized protein BDV37DRAFT_286497 [Aspergillus pseudonomiae]KAE8400623.1 hypothetical protein BDV37DRAFT_286497 [Aspergillus pseudonomiae]